MLVNTNDDDLEYRTPQFINYYLNTNKNIKPKLFDNVYVLFADIVGFTELLVNNDNNLTFVNDLLNNLFIDFDKICNEYNVHKVETIGDCYMCIYGLYEEEINNSETILEFALKLLSIVKSKYKIQIRIGIGYGQVIMSMLGLHNKKVCFIGKCINLASRLQNYALTNSIIVCEDTYKLNMTKFNYKEYEENIKGIGKLKTYHIVGSNYSLAEDKFSNTHILHKFKKHILIVDDSEITLKVMKKKFNDLNINTSTCESIDEMIILLKKYYFDAIILDNNFDNSNEKGIEVIDKLVDTENTVVCIFSADNIKTNKLFIRKPWTNYDINYFLSKIEITKNNC